MARCIFYLSICHLPHALVIADRRPQVALHVHLPFMAVFRDGETSYQYAEPEVTVTRHDGGLPTRCLLSRSQVLTRGLSHRHCQGISLELCLTSRESWNVQPRWGRVYYLWNHPQHPSSFWHVLMCAIIWLDCLTALEANPKHNPN